MALNISFIDLLQPSYWPYGPIQIGSEKPDLSEFSICGNKTLLFLPALSVSLSPAVCSVFTEPLSQMLQGSQKRNVQFWTIFCLQQFSIGVADHHWVLLCLASLMKPWFPKLPLCMFLLSSLCPKSLCLSQCQELPFGFVCRVLIANWTNKLTD